jgi:hypothetical protein
MTTDDYRNLKKLAKKFIKEVGASTEATNSSGPMDVRHVSAQAMNRWQQRVSLGSATMISDKEGPKIRETIDGITFTLTLTASAVDPTPDFKKIFILAEHYFEASKLLDDQSRRDQSKEENLYCSRPKLLVDSFAGELYLKCFYVQDSKEPPYGHDWEDLFNDLNPGTQKAIRLEYVHLTDTDLMVGNIPLLSQVNPGAVETTLKIRDFDRALKAASKTFANMRYAYEQVQKGEWFYAHFLVNSFRNVLIRDFRIPDSLKKPKNEA